MVIIMMILMIMLMISALLDPDLSRGHGCSFIRGRCGGNVSPCPEVRTLLPSAVGRLEHCNNNDDDNDDDNDNDAGHGQRVQPTAGLW